MKKIFTEPKMNISYFEVENIVTNSGADSGTKGAEVTELDTANYKVYTTSLTDLNIVF